jgi:hypothetical protein
MRVDSKNCVRSVLDAWLLLWLITIPLFHIHYEREASSAHHAQTGIIHTVFARDLPNEYGPWQAPYQSVRSRTSNYPELAFSYLTPQNAPSTFSILAGLTSADVPDGDHRIAPSFRQDVVLDTFSENDSPPRGPPPVS